MIYFVTSLFVGLTILFLLYAVSKIKKMSTNNTMQKNDGILLEKIHLNKWRGGVRFPAGYYKTTEEFYQIEKNLKYHR